MLSVSIRDILDALDFVTDLLKDPTPAGQTGQQPHNVPADVTVLVNTILGFGRRGFSAREIMAELFRLNAHEYGYIRQSDEPIEPDPTTPDIPSIETAHILWRGKSENGKAACIISPELGVPGVAVRSVNGIEYKGNYTGPCTDDQGRGCRGFPHGAVYRWAVRGKDIVGPATLTIGTHMYLIPHPGREYDPR